MLHVAFLLCLGIIVPVFSQSAAIKQTEEAEPTEITETLEEPEHIDAIAEFSEIINKVADKTGRKVHESENLSLSKAYFDDLYIQGSPAVREIFHTLIQELKLSLFLTTWSTHAKERIIDSILQQAYTALLKEASSALEKHKALKFYRSLRLAVAPALTGTREKIRKLPWKTLLALAVVAAGGTFAYKKSLWSKAVTKVLAPIRGYKETADRALVLAESLNTPDPNLVTAFEADRTSGRVATRLQGNKYVYVDTHNNDTVVEPPRGRIGQFAEAAEKMSAKLPDKQPLTELLNAAKIALPRITAIGEDMTRILDDAGVKNFLGVITAQLQLAQEQTFRSMKAVRGLLAENATTANELAEGVTMKWDPLTRAPVYYDAHEALLFTGQISSLDYLLNTLVTTTQPNSEAMKFLAVIREQVNSAVQNNKAILKAYNLADDEDRLVEGVIPSQEGGRFFYRVPITFFDADIQRNLRSNGSIPAQKTTIHMPSRHAHATPAAGDGSSALPTETEMVTITSEMALDALNREYVKLYPPANPVDRICSILEKNTTTDLVTVVRELIVELPKIIKAATKGVVWRAFGAK